MWRSNGAGELPAIVTRAYLSLGSNIGDRLAHLVAAVRAIGETERIAALSPIYETAPLGPDGRVVPDQDAFLNCVVAIETSATPSELRARTVAIEEAMGRDRRVRWRPRPIDIDIILFGDARVDQPSLVIPHARMHERAFVVRPLLDLDPTVEAPGVGPLAPLLAALDDQEVRLHTEAGEFGALVSGAETR